MVPRLEIRWFLPLEPSERPTIFPTGSQSSTRIDWYAPSHAACGVKLREGNLEVKLLLRDLGLRDFGGKIGQVEEWRKWIFEAQGNAAPFAKHLPAAGWVAVQKRRSLLLFSLSDGKPRQVHRWPASGCQFEWTEVTVNQIRRLTLGFEAFGHPSQLEDNLTKTAARVLQELPSGLQLDETTSYSYPEWLNRLLRNKN